GAGLAPAAVLTPVPVTPATPVATSTSTPGTTSGGSTTSGTGATPVTTTTPTNPSVAPGVGGPAPTPGVSGTGNRFFTNIATPMNLSWELDFWGLFRRNLEAADSSLDQSIANYDELVVLLLANVATQYMEIRTLQKRLELARKNVALQEPLVA